MKKYDLAFITPSKRKFKKYDAVLKEKMSRRAVTVSFGDMRYQHFKDQTTDKTFKHLNHLDPVRRWRYKKRHEGHIKKGYYSPGYFSMKYLW